MAAAGLTAEALADIVSVTEAAQLAEHKGRHARTAELFDHAAERAVAAGAPPDSLILASLRLRQALALLCLSGEAGVPAASAAAMRTESWATTREVMRTLSARDQAGTLLPGTLPADELAFSEAVLRVLLRIVLPERLQDAMLGAQLKFDAPLLGYDVMMRCSSHVLIALHRPPLPGAEVTAAQAFVLRALALMAEVRHDSHFGLIRSAADAQFMKYLTTFVIAPENRAYVRGEILQSQFYDALVAAWNAPALQEALFSSGTLEFIYQSSSIDEILAEGLAHRAADVAAVGLHACALPACGVREVSVHQFKRCGGCKAVVYCSAECAKAHWKAGHKRECSRVALPAQPKNE